MIWNFPRVKFCNNGAIIKQISHLRSEVDEAIAAAMTPDIEHTAMELMDVLHSAETALRIMAEFHGVNLHKVRRDCELKNHERGYYDQN